MACDRPWRKLCTAVYYAFGLSFAVLPSVLLPSKCLAQGMVAYRGTVGPHHYWDNGLSLSGHNSLGLFGVGDADMYSSDSSNGTFKTLSALLGLVQPWGEIGIFGYLTPQVNSYQSKGFGAESSFKFWSGGRWRDGDWVMNEGETIFDEDLPYRLYGTLNYSRGFDSQIVPPDTIRINSDTWTIGLRGAAYRTVVSAGISQSFYSEDLRSSEFQSSQNSLVQVETDLQHGYPDRAGYIRLSQDIIPGFWIFTGYTHTGYILGPAKAADYYSAGTGASWNRWRGAFEYTDFKPEGGPSQDYYSVSVSMKLGGGTHGAAEENPAPRQEKHHVDRSKQDILIIPYW